MSAEYEKHRDAAVSASFKANAHTMGMLGKDISKAAHHHEKGRQLHQKAAELHHKASDATSGLDPAQANDLKAKHLSMADRHMKDISHYHGAAASVSMSSDRSHFTATAKANESSKAAHEATAKASGYEGHGIASLEHTKAAVNHLEAAQAHKSASSHDMAAVHHGVAARHLQQAHEHTKKMGVSSVGMSQDIMPDLVDELSLRAVGQWDDIASARRAI